MVPLALLVAAGGCGKSNTPTQTAVQATPTPTPSASPTPLPLSATVQKLDLTLLDRDGKMVAKLAAKAGRVGSQGGKAPEGAAQLKEGTATLYQNGKPTATLIADTLTADRKTQVVQGKGNVLVRSLIHKGAPAIRADVVTWTYGSSKIIGTGNVVATLNSPAWKLPGDRFEADTAIERFCVFTNGKPVTGSF